jgi:hypothetical protein
MVAADFRRHDEGRAVTRSELPFHDRHAPVPGLAEFVGFVGSPPAVGVLIPCDCGALHPMVAEMVTAALSATMKDFFFTVDGSMGIFPSAIGKSFGSRSSSIVTFFALPYSEHSKAQFGVRTAQTNETNG